MSTFNSSHPTCSGPIWSGLKLDPCWSLGTQAQSVKLFHPDSIPHLPWSPGLHVPSPWVPHLWRIYHGTANHTLRYPAVETQIFLAQIKGVYVSLFLWKLVKLSWLFIILFRKLDYTYFLKNHKIILPYKETYIYS